MPRPASIYFFGGTNELLVKQEAQKLADKLVPAKDREFGLEIINGAALNLDEAITALRRLREALDTLPFFGGSKVVWFKNTNLVGDLKFARESPTLVDDLSDFAAYLKKGLPEGVTLLISATQVDKRRALWKTLEKIADCNLYELPDLDKREGREQLAAIVQAKLKDEGKRISPDALELFIELVGANPTACSNEIEKLSMYVGDRAEITEDDVATVVSATGTVNIWKLMDAIGARDAAVAMRMLDNLIAHRESVIGILMLLAAQVRFMLWMKDLTERKLVHPRTGFDGGKDFMFQLNKLTPDQSAHLRDPKTGNLPNAFRLHRCALAAQKFSQRELIAAMQTLLEANRAIVTSALNDRTVLEEAILKIVTGANHKPAPIAPRKTEGSSQFVNLSA
jgi:DNA polymerase-3 subunit delta